MAEEIESLIKYKDGIQDIPVNKIEANPLNPRERYVEHEEDELIESIISKGILKPITVFKRKKDGKYIILDGERRYEACNKLNISKIHAIELVREPTNLENLSMMFHIHNVREEWTDFAISITLRRVVEEMGKDIRKLKSSDIKELSKITSLSVYKIKKYLQFQDYPEEVIDRFLESEKKEKPEKGVDPDILSEMHRPIKQIKNLMPEILEKYPVTKIINSCIKKKAKNIIKTNKEFRLLSKSLTAAKKGEIRKEVLKDKIINFIKKEGVTPEKIYADTSKTVYQIKSIIKNTDVLYDEIKNLNLKKLTKEEKGKLKKKLIELVKLIEIKILK